MQEQRRKQYIMFIWIYPLVLHWRCDARHLSDWALTGPVSSMTGLRSAATMARPAADSLHSPGHHLSSSATTTDTLTHEMQMLVLISLVALLLLATLPPTHGLHLPYILSSQM